MNSVTNKVTDKTLELAMELISLPSVTPDDHGCQELLIERLETMDFQVERLRFGKVDNFWARRGSNTPLLVFVGHTDVVPSGPRYLWESEPFKAEIRDGVLYGRGASDMKSSLAAFITGIEDFLTKHTRYRGSIGLLITSDEEGPSVDGTVKVVEWLKQKKIKIDYCVVGEPTSTESLGDVIKNGRRGSLSGTLVVHGIQGHVAYPHLADNPIHALAPALTELVSVEWDQGNEYFPKTTFQISNIHAGTGAENVIPGSVELDFNFRHSTAVTQDELKLRLETLLTSHGLNTTITWTGSGTPFFTPPGKLVDAVKTAIKAELGIEPALSTTGGTSDGRFIAPTGAEVVEFGPTNRTIHKANECIVATDPGRLARVYARILEQCLAPEK